MKVLRLCLRPRWRYLRYALIALACVLALGAKKPACGGSSGGSSGMGCFPNCTAGGSSGGTSLSGTLNCGQLEQLWMQAGGSGSDEQLMAAIAMAESDGNQYAYLADSNGTNDEGYWAINSANAGSYYPAGADRYDPMTNAKAAVAILNGVGLGAWVTYNKGMEHGFCGE